MLPSEMARMILAIPNGNGSSFSIRIKAPSGSTVIAEKDGLTYTAKEDNGVWDIKVPEYGVYTIKATLGDDEVSVTIDNLPIEVSLNYSPLVYGVVWDVYNPSTILTRLTSENDDNHLVNTNIIDNPIAAIGSELGSSPFDNLSPWREMEEYNIIDNEVSFKRGLNGFSRTENDTVIYIPEFYYKKIYAGGKHYFYICDRPRDGFEKHPGSGRYVGRYNTAISGNDYLSKSNTAPLVDITRETARNSSHAKGDNWWQYDYATWCAVWLLYLVEYADWDSLKVIGRGIVDDTSSNAFNNGGTDAMIYHTGRAEGIDGYTAVQYRGIENPWGNVFEWIDGINFNSRAVYISLDNANFKDDTNSGYTAVGANLPSTDNYITSLPAPNSFSWAFLPSGSSGGSDTTYIPDRVYSNINWRVLTVGGGWYYASFSGLFCFRAGYVSSALGSDIGTRLLYIPSEVIT